MTTAGDDGVSVAAKFRPCTMPTPSVSKYSRETRATSITSPLSSGPCRSGRKTLLRLKLIENGSRLASPADSTPGIARTRSRARS